MKKISRLGCGEITYNSRFICFGGNQIGIMDRFSESVLDSLKGAKNITSLQIDDEYIYAKTTIGIYHMFNLESRELQYRDYYRKKKDTSHDGKMLLYEKGIILDILTLKDGLYYFLKCDLVSHIFKSVCISKANYSLKDWCVDFLDRKAYILFLERCCLNHSETNCYISVVNIDTLQVEEEIPLIYAYGIFPLGLVNKHSVLLNNMQIADVYSSERFLLDTYNGFRDKTCGYYVRMNCMSEGKMILVFSKCVFIYDLITGNLIKKIDSQYVSNAMCIDDKIYIATWNGLYLTT